MAREDNHDELILGLYRPLGDPIAGGMGKVQRVHHAGWNVDLAMKQPHAHLFETDAQKQNFIHECEAWINLGLHPHIVSCHYVRQVNGIPSIFAEWMEGGSLANWIKAQKLYEDGKSEALRRILDIAIQFAWGLDYAHEQGLIHQDVKPDNVLLTPGGDVKVSDFGIANAKRDICQAGSTIGGFEGTLISEARAYTPAYCAPEQAIGGTLSRRTDIWSWAVSVMEMFVGERLWSSGPVAGNACDSYFEVARVPVPESVKDLLRKCFKSNEAERPHDLKIVADSVHGIYETVVGEEYPREFPEAAKLQGDALNNRAVSMLDLGRAADAEKLFNQALEIDPGHPQATYNQGLHLWRSGRMTDTAVVVVLRQSQSSRPGDWNVPYLLGMVHLERQDTDAAATAFSTAQKLNTGIDIRHALEDAKRITNCEPKCLRTFEGHTGYVSSVALSVDGLWALSGSGDKTLRLWDVSSGRCLRIFEGHTEAVRSIALSADGRWALSGSVDKTLRLWDVSNGTCLRTFEGYTENVSSVALSEDGRWALSGNMSRSNTIRFWDVSSGKCLRIFEGHTAYVSSVALSADGRWTLTGSVGKALRLWDLSSGECLRTFEGHIGSVNSVALSADGRRALSGSVDKTLRLWDVSSGKCLKTFKGHTEAVRSVSLSADGRRALSGGEWDKTIRLWDVSSGKCLRTFEGHTEPVSSVSLSADGRWALSGSVDKTLRLWDMSGLLDAHQALSSPFVVCNLADTKETVDVQKHFDSLLDAAVKALAEREYGRAWCFACESRTLPGYQFSSKALDVVNQAGSRGVRTRLRGGWCWRSINGHAEDVSSVTLSADGRWALSGSEDMTLRFWEVSSGTCLRTFEGHTGSVNSVALSADGRCALSGSEDMTLRLWDLSSGECLRTFVGHPQDVRSVALSADGRWALSGSGNKTLRLYSGSGEKILSIWDVRSGRCLRIFEGHTKTHGVRSVALSADGCWALSGSGDGTLRLWDVCSGKCQRVFEGHKNGVSSVALSADSRWALSGSWDRTLRLWDASSGTCLRTFEGHAGSVNSVALTTDGRWALSGSEDKTLRLWNLTNGECLRTLEGHTGSVNSVALSANGRWALSGSQDKSMRLWELDWEVEFPGWSDWDEDVRPLLETFLFQHRPYAAELPTYTPPSDEQIKLALARRGKPTWTDQDFHHLMTQLQYAGFGWVRPEGVRRELAKMTTNWPL